MSGYAALAGVVGGLAGGGVTALGASRKKKALNKAEAAYYDAMSRNLDNEHGIAGLEQGDYRTLAAGHNANLSSLIDNFNGAQPANDGYATHLADTIGKADAATPMMDQSWAYSGAPAVDTTNREVAKTGARRTRLIDAMGAQHDLTTQNDAKMLALEGYNRGEMPLASRADQLAQYYGVGKASRDYQWTKQRNALALALKKAGTTGDEQMMWGSLIGSIAGGAGAAGGGSSSGGSSDSSGGGSYAAPDYASESGGYYDNNGNVVRGAQPA